MHGVQQRSHSSKTLQSLCAALEDHRYSCTDHVLQTLVLGHCVNHESWQHHLARHAAWNLRPDPALAAAAGAAAALAAPVAALTAAAAAAALIAAAPALTAAAVSLTASAVLAVSASWTVAFLSPAAAAAVPDVALLEACCCQRWQHSAGAALPASFGSAGLLRLTKQRAGQGIGPSVPFAPV